MAAVYTNAMLTFAASAAADGSGGCASNFNSSLCVPLDGDTAYIRFEDYHNLDSKDAPLNTRGWAFQEAALSRRMICFLEDQMLWKCSSKHESEDGLLSLFDASPIKNDNVWNIWALLQKGDTGKPNYAVWYRMMENFSRRKLTFEKDKLAAMAGIVEEFGGLVGDTPAMGLWRGDMLNGLLWRTDEPTRRLDCHDAMPSWSWTSVSGPVRWKHGLPSPSGAMPRNQLEITSFKIDWAGLPMTSQVLGAKLTVRGRMKRVQLSKWEVVRRNSFHLHGIDGSIPQAEIEKRESPAPEVLGYCYLEELQPTDS